MIIMLWTPQIWLSHKRRQYIKTCPHCGKEIVWICDGIDWMPCDKEPVLFSIVPDGKLKIVYHRKVLSGCDLYRRGDDRFDKKPLWGRQQHYYTCPVLKKARREYVTQRGGANGEKTKAGD